MRSGGLKGTRLIVKTPVANIGRADYNDLVLPDESVSTSHAKLQRREGVWVLMDLDSTNGTYVDGERISADTPIAPGTLVRFGDVQLVFEPTDDAMGVAKGGGTKVIESFKPPPPRPPSSASGSGCRLPAPVAAAPPAAAAARRRPAAPPAKPAAQPAKPAPPPAPRQDAAKTGRSLEASGRPGAAEEGQGLWVERGRGRSRGIGVDLLDPGVAAQRAHHLRGSDRRRHHPVGE